MRYVEGGYYDDAGKFYPYDEYTKQFLTAAPSQIHPSSRRNHRQSLGQAKTRRIRRSLAKRDGYKCYLCGRLDIDDSELEIEHKTPRSRGGTNELSNLGFACPPCNDKKGDMTEAEYRVFRLIEDKAERKKFLKNRFNGSVGTGMKGLSRALGEHWPQQ